MTAELRLECCEDYGAFQALSSEWDIFMARYFPERYARSHGWLCAWWKTYHHRRPALVYLQRSPDGRIVAAAPLVIVRENFGGFPVLSVATMGRGLGSEDFLVSGDSRGFIPEVFADLARRRWQVARLSRLIAPSFVEELRCYLAGSRLGCESVETDDFLVRIPGDFAEYLKSRTRKFRRNLNQAVNRLEREGEVSLLRLDPFKETEQVWSLGKKVAETSWQHQIGNSHFFDRGEGDFYRNLSEVQGERGAADFFVLMSGGRPAAYLLGCCRERTYYAVDTAFHADFRKISAGRVLFSQVIEKLISEQRVELLDFEGSGEYKDDYSNLQRRACSFTLYNSSLYASAVRVIRASSLYAKIRRRIKKELPVQPGSTEEVSGTPAVEAGGTPGECMLSEGREA